MSATFVQSLELADLPHCLHLSAQAGWNQTEADWRLMLTGHAFGFRDGRNLIATAVVFPYRPTAAWISMVLVDESWRRRGLATRLMDACLTRCAELGLIPVLDATDAGRSVYSSLGFSAGPTATRFVNRLWGHVDAPDLPINRSAAVRRLSLADAPRIGLWDSHRFGLNRTRVLEHQITTAPDLAWLMEDDDGTIQGYATGRLGRLATQIGPVVATTDAVAVSLVSSVMSRIGGPVVLDVSDRHRSLQSILTNAANFSPERSFVRMSLGAIEVPVSAENCFVLGGPEIG